MSIRVRRATDADFDALIRHDERGFGQDHSPGWVAGMRSYLDMDRFLLAEEGDGIVGAAGSAPFPMGVPGGQLDIEGVTWVSVLPTHRRRGILRALMHTQLRGMAAAGVTVAALMASRGGIYGRFGYGAASEFRRIRIDRRTAAFRADLPDPGEARLATAAEARDHAIAVQRRWAAVTPGSVLRDPLVWDLVLADPEARRHGGTSLFHLVHPDGYASFRMHHDQATLDVHDLFAATPQAHHALWRILLGNDMASFVETAVCPPGDPLSFLLTNPRLVETTELRDGVWIRILDPAAALAARRYAVELELVLEVRDPVTDEKTRVRLAGGPDGAVCTPTSDTPAVSLGSSALGALYLGWHDATVLARAGLVDGDPAVLGRMTAAFRSSREPAHGTNF